MLDLSRAIRRLNAEIPIIRDSSVATASHSIEDDAASAAQAELLNFLDDALSAGCRVVDYAPGDGDMAIHAATAPAGDVRVLAIADDNTACDRIRVRFRAQSIEQSATARHDPTHALTLDALTATELANAMPLFVHAGDAASIPWLAKGALESIRKARIGVIAWRCSDLSSPKSTTMASDADVAATVLAVLGFSHYALVERDGALELVPLSMMASNSYVFSVSPAQQAAWSA